MSRYLLGLQSEYDYPPTRRERLYWASVRLWRRVRYGLPSLDYYKRCARCGERGENHAPNWRGVKGCWRFKSLKNVEVHFAMRGMTFCGIVLYPAGGRPPLPKGTTAVAPWHWEGSGHACPRCQANWEIHRAWADTYYRDGEVGYCPCPFHDGNWEEAFKGSIDV